MSTNGPETPVQTSAFGCITVPFLLIALVPLVWGARTQWEKGDLSRRGEVVQGRVTELRFVASNPAVVAQGTRGGSPRGESPVVAFTTRAGESRTVVGSVNRRPAPWAVGGSVDVVYDPANPARADLRSEVDGWRFWFGFWCALSALPGAVALLPVLLRRRERRTRRSAEGSLSD